MLDILLGLRPPAPVPSAARQHVRKVRSETPSPRREKREARVRRVHAYVRENPGVTTAQVVEALDIPRTSGQWCLDELEKRGVLYHIRARRSGTRHEWAIVGVRIPGRTAEEAKPKKRPRRKTTPVTLKKVLAAMSTEEALPVSTIAKRAGVAINTARARMTDLKRAGLAEDETRQLPGGKFYKVWRRVVAQAELRDAARHAADCLETLRNPQGEPHDNQ